MRVSREISLRSSLHRASTDALIALGNSAKKCDILHKSLDPAHAGKTLRNSK